MILARSTLKSNEAKCSLLQEDEESDFEALEKPIIIKSISTLLNLYHFCKF
jgi:hypothetical protein